MAQNLSDEARQRKNEYNADYIKRTNRAAQEKWDLKNKQNKKQQVFSLFLPKDQDMLDWLNNKPNKAGYIKELIRADIERSRQSDN